MPHEIAGDAGEWLRKARRDLQAAERLSVGDDPLFDVAVYHCQQAAEKALKGYLTYHASAFEKTHSLPMLLWQARDLDAGLDSFVESAEFLNPFATRFRYPGGRLEPDADEAHAAMARARGIIVAIEQRLMNA